MQKSGIFSKIKTANLIGGFLAMLCISPAISVDVTTNVFTQGVLSSSAGGAPDGDMCGWSVDVAWGSTCEGGHYCVPVCPYGDCGLPDRCCRDNHQVLEERWGPTGNGIEASDALYIWCEELGGSGTNSFTTYRCAAGYYGTPTQNSQVCYKCPSGKTSNAGATSINDCYYETKHKKGDPFVDDYGSGTYKNDCY